MSRPEEKITCVSNLWLRQMVFKNVGDANDGHTHNYDHVTLLAHGSVRVYVDGIATDFIAPQIIYIIKGKVHHIEALEPDTIAYCVHALRDKDTAEILAPEQIPEGVNALLTGLARHL